MFEHLESESLDVFENVMPDVVTQSPEEDSPKCYSLTMFTDRWREIRDFYVNVLHGNVLSERTDRYCEMNLGGIPICIRRSEFGEDVSYLHFYLTLENSGPVLKDLRRRGVVVTNVGPYAVFRDPEGRVVKLSEEKTYVD